jgi:hypothetical protein
MESPEVAEFRHYVMEASWEQAEAALVRLGVTDEDNLMVRSTVAWLFTLEPHSSDCPQESRLLISQQKYLELLENRNTTAALMVLRNELASHNTDPEHLHSLSRSVVRTCLSQNFIDSLGHSLIMCSTPEDLRRRAGWDGARGTSRARLLNNLQSMFQVSRSYHPLPA